MAGVQPRLKYHCVAVIGGVRACAAAKALKDQRLLSADAPPRLPLATCDMPGDCRCTYRHFDDRRSGPRRADERGTRPTPWTSNTDRRRKGPAGRRDSDFD